MMDVVEDLDDPAVPITTACAALGLSRSTLYRNTRPQTPRKAGQRKPSPRRLSDKERQRILDTVHSAEFLDQSVPEIYSTLLTKGTYLASMRTIYRTLAEHGETKERRAQRSPKKHVKPSLEARAPNQVWTWDITKLATLQRGVFLQLYVIIDLFSRFVVGWLLADKECKHLAAQLFAETITRHDVEPGLTVHADRGSAMKSDTLAQLLSDLGVQRSFSRPRVSDDNAFSEAQFKTLKYQSTYPGRFETRTHAQGWLELFFGWYNEEHHHGGLAYFTPGEVYRGSVDVKASVRQAALDAKYREHPERFVHGPPKVPRPPACVAINPPNVDTTLESVLPDSNATKQCQC